MLKMIFGLLLLLPTALFSVSDTQEGYENCACDAPRYWYLYSKDSGVSDQTQHCSYSTPCSLLEDTSRYYCDKYYKNWQTHHYVFKYSKKWTTTQYVNYYDNHYANEFYQCLLCNESDIPFPVQESNATYSTPWRSDTLDAPASHQQCIDSNGTIESGKLTCVNYERCKLPAVCDETQANFPAKGDNEEILYQWSGVDNNLTTACEDLNGSVQTANTPCEDLHRCVKKTDEDQPICDESISSYVSPRDTTFHEEIAISGSEYGLHYSSGDIDENRSRTVAYGWSLNGHAVFSGDKLYLDSTIYAVDTPVQENGNLVVKLGTHEYLFDAEGKHVLTRDAYTKQTISSFLYDGQGLLTTVTDAFSQTTTLNRDANGTVISVTAPHGQSTYLNVDANGDLTEVQYEDLSSYGFTYENHLMTQETEPNGNSFLHIFDSNGKVVKVVDAEQGEWLFGQSSGATALDINVTRAAGDAVAYKKHYLANGLLVTEKFLPSGDTVLYENAVDDTLSSTTMCSEKTTSTYLTANGVLVKDPAEGRRILASTTRTEPSGLSMQTAYTASYTMDGDSVSKVVRTATTNGATVTNERDYSGSTQTTVSAEGITSSQTYDAANRLMLSSQLGNLLPVQYGYDNEGRLTTVTQGTRTTTYVYNADGHLDSVIDPDGLTTGYAYDLLGRRTQITHPNLHTTDFQYDANGNMIVLTTPIPRDHSFSYNGVNKRDSYTSPLGKATAYIYDKQRRLITLMKPSGKTVVTTYSGGRVSQVQTPEGNTTYGYDCGDNPSTVMRGSEQIDYGYDGALVTSIAQSGVLNQTMSLGYNSDFRVESFTYAGASESYVYNGDGQPTQIGGAQMTYSPENGLLTSVNSGDIHFDLQMTYNDYGETDTSTIKGTGVYRYNYQILQRSPAGKITQRLEGSEVNPLALYEYKYNSLGRLIEAKDLYSGSVESYVYDANGNRQSATINGVTTTANFTLDDQVVVYGQNTYAYDDDGYLSEKTTPEGTTTYEYGTLGELIKVVKPDGTVIEYLQNANNQRVAKKINGQIVEKYLWKDLTTLLAVYDGNDNLISRFEYAAGRMPYKMTTGSGKVFYLAYDQVGTFKYAYEKPLFLFLGDRKAVKYDTYGNILSDSNPDVKVPFGFAGGLYDPDTKLTRFGYRDYDAYTGKWMAKDPIGFAGGDTNLYGYVLGDPANFIDPTGKFAFLIPLFPTIGVAVLGIGYSILNPPPAFHPVAWDDSWENNSPYCANDDKMLSPGEIERLKRGGIHPHDLKENSRQDLYKKKNGDIVVKRKGGKGPGEPTGLNINDF
ncbi:polymorphic toxin type 33 domain-containing protein [Sulfurimonas sp. HSL-3221]|uniref:RHS repeat-associated core domain-containing protein n=1 Tax=Sulfurimonadaceae TaxID=2771471 RepID=UPI001E61625F|nr:RHS repeat-associated core domain-containing protein [Sulfurimonas sp. HSL-3221]UFS62754.1 polymorphic toxin type 33 domain-containing protein [Sulfurimonas sp. HSL-3221]